MINKTQVDEADLNKSVPDIAVESRVLILSACTWDHGYIIQRALFKGLRNMFIYVLYKPISTAVLVL